MSKHGMKQPSRKKNPIEVVKNIQSYAEKYMGVPEGGMIPNVKVPTMTWNPKTNQRTVSFNNPNQLYWASDAKFTVPECVYVETKYYWVKNIKDGNTYMASERIEKQDDKLISCWSVRDGPECTSSTGFAKEGILANYEIIEEVCPPTSKW